MLSLQILKRYSAVVVKARRDQFYISFLEIPALSNSIVG